MRRTLTATVAVVAASAAVPATAHADRSDCPRKLERSYSKHYAKVARVHGTRAPGRNIRKNGMLVTWGKNGRHKAAFDAMCSELRRSRRQLIKLLRPPRYPTLVRTAVPPPQRPAGVMSAGQDGAYSGYAIPESIVMCESGGDYGAVNPSSGAYGAYQIMPSTSAAYGCDMSTPAGQDECAAKVWAGQGRGAWSC